ncbi:MAG: thymidylate synthase [archaeon]
MRTFTFDNFEKAYPELLKALLNEGKEVSPRGMLTKEISPVGITINNPRKKVISHPVRKLNYGFMVGELLWILQGSNDLEHVAHYNKQWRNYTDDGETLNGAYGQRIFNWDAAYDIIVEDEIDEEGNTHPTFDVQHTVIDQFEMAYSQLKADPDTRQATIVLFNPKQDYTKTKDKPCTNLIRFMIRNNKLNMTVFMRSNDIWFGFPYDIFNFTMLQELMAGKLGVEVGKYTHIVDSFHIYEMHFKKAKELIKQKNKDVYNNMIDGRLDNDNYKDELKLVYDVEATTRNTSMIIKIDLIKEMINKINNEYWKSLAGLIAAYNFRKAKRDQSEINEFKKYVTNEFKTLIQSW